MMRYMSTVCSKCLCIYELHVNLSTHYCVSHCSMSMVVLQEKLMGHLGVVLYEYLGEEYPEVLGSILGALKVS